jgi:hypothetical protein
VCKWRRETADCLYGGCSQGCSAKNDLATQYNIMSCSKDAGSKDRCETGEGKGGVRENKRKADRAYRINGLMDYGPRNAAG